MRVLLVDDHPLFRQALAATVRQIAPEHSIEHYDTLGEARAALGAGEDALVLLDLKLPDSHGISGLLGLKAQAPAATVAIVSASDDHETVQTAQACGASGFISKAVSVEELAAAIETLLAGAEWFTETGPDHGRAPLTTAQARIVEGVHRGLMNKQIAYEMGISEATVKYHLTGIFRKMGVQTRAQLLTLARD
ncbi:response regulator transcription factor [Novosphingobium sediminicola]|uniref:DNA-binding NarL/FixJ family response regulator n=1 Tax=Novosphingobium sediminicola TaxID=563162 RepID=A0A7W6CJA8_9SPHN|nr:response regulator transcription factor [Novosphingobium sediminicola]MBB3956475.1 DNA-binding NarL/FixJ family response regulator [Novosphingobium sediminicola]